MIIHLRLDYLGPEMTFWDEGTATSFKAKEPISWFKEADITKWTQPQIHWVIFIIQKEPVSREQVGEADKPEKTFLSSVGVTGSKLLPITAQDLDPGTSTGPLQSEPNFESS